jgi:H+/Cl- antiporter ClcA
MSFIKTLLARPLAWLTAFAIGAGGGAIAWLLDYITTAKTQAEAAGGTDALWLVPLLALFAKFVGAVVAKYFPKPLVPPVEPEPEPPSASRVRDY